MRHPGKDEIPGKGDHSGEDIREAEKEEVIYIYSSQDRLIEMI